MNERLELQELRRLDELEARALAWGQMTHKPGPTPVNVLDEGANLLKNVGTAVYKGFLGIPALALDARRGSYDTTDALAAFMGQPERKLDRTLPTTRALEATGYQPKTLGEKVLNSTVRGAAGALLGPGAIANTGRALITGGLAGGSGEVVGNFQGIKDTPSEPYARLAAGLIGGVGGGLATSQIRNAPKLAAEALEGITPQQLDEATILMREAQRAGIPLNANQAVTGNTNLDNLVSTLLSRPEGQQLLNQLRKQPEAALELANRVVRQVPGEVKTPQEIANASQKLATETIQEARNARTAATAPLYSQTGVLPPATVISMFQQAKAAAKDAPNTAKGALYNALADSMVSGKKVILDGEKLNAAFRTQLNAVKNPNLSATAGDREAVGALQRMVADFRGQMGAVSPKFKEANELYSEISREVVDPLKASVVGRVAGASGALADKEAVNKLLPIIAAGRDPATKTSEILKMAAISRDKPEIFTNAVKTHISDVISQSFKISKGDLSPDFAANFERNLVGTSAKAQGLKDSLKGIAQLNNIPEDELQKGFLSAIRIIGATAKRPAAAGPSAETFNTIANKSLSAAALKTIGLAPGKPLARAVERAFSSDAYRTLADQLTTPEGLTRLRELGRTPIMSTTSQTLVNTMLGLGASQTGDSGQ